ncbi:MAG TPA: lytic transglycosylase domain-containing protein [Steroidobacteraceae bacterium]|nr:lytic transglycosylase domain-containing protein [Steroidobacteraceae bacterium]
MRNIARAALCALLPLSLGPWTAAHADQQQDPELKAVIAAAISQAQCFADRFDSAVWYRLMTPRMQARLTDPREQTDVADILGAVYCETHRRDVRPLPPGLVLAMIDVESRFDRYAVSRAGAVGLMQVMLFWPQQLGMSRRDLTNTARNIRMGCAILRYYLQAEHNNYRRALARYNGSPGRRKYPDLVLARWAHWAGADDLGRSPVVRSAAQPTPGPPPSHPPT